MSERTVSIKTYRKQRAYGDTYYRAEVDFHLSEPGSFGGRPPEEQAIAIAKALWPTLQTLELTASPHPDARVAHEPVTDKIRADKWVIRGTATYSG